MAKRGLSRIYPTSPLKLRCLNCNAVLKELREKGDSWGWPCFCSRCGLEHDYTNGGTVDTEYALYAVFDSDIHTPKETFNHLFIEWVALLLSITGIILNANKLILCWPVWILSCIAWILYFTLDQKRGGRLQTAAIIMNAVFLISNIYGWIQWSK